nr:MAG TPA: hypothetical protein [Caudoviricetes sp.]
MFSDAKLRQYIITHKWHFIGFQYVVNKNEKE